MKKTELLKEIEQFKEKTMPQTEVKELIALYPYFTLAQLVQATKESKHTFNLHALFPDRSYLKTLLSTNEDRQSTKLIDENLKKSSFQTEEKDKLNETSVESKELMYHSDTENVSIDELIEKFNTSYPKISICIEQSEEDEVYEDLCKTSVSEKMNIISETLAKVYVNQGAYDKAIKIYRALIVKYPEKNSIFANLIEELKEKKNSQKI